MRVLVTGGAGFIGSHLADALIAAGHELTVLDNLSTGLRHQVPEQAEFCETDLRDREAVHACLRRARPQIVYHLAAQADVRRSMREPAYDVDVNVKGTLHLLELAAELELERFVFASTGGAVYGEPEQLPVDETHPVRPLSVYGASKAAVEHYLSVYSQTEDLTTVALRFANVYGPRQNPKGEAGVVAIFSTQLLNSQQPVIFGDGSKTRDYVYVADIVAACLAALELDHSGAFNIGTGVATSDQQVFDTVAQALGSAARPEYGPRRKGEVEHIALDAGKARRELGWRPGFDFAKGVAQAAAWYREQHSRG